MSAGVYTEQHYEQMLAANRNLVASLKASLDTATKERDEARASVRKFDNEAESCAYRNGKLKDQLDVVKQQRDEALRGQDTLRKELHKVTAGRDCTARELGDVSQELDYLKRLTEAQSRLIAALQLQTYYGEGMDAVESAGRDVLRCKLAGIQP